MILRFTIPGLPIAKGRPRFGMRAGKPCAFTPARTVSYEGKVALAGSDAMAGAAPFDGPVAVSIVAWFPIAASWSKRKQADARAGLLSHTSHPDADNILKAIGDGLNGIVWKDDRQIADVHIVKKLGDSVGVAVEGRRLAVPT